MKKYIFTLFLTTIICAPLSLSAQTTIGCGEAPQEFSVLELISNDTQGLRLPQMTMTQRIALQNSQEFQSEKTNRARGLMIFNTSNRCVETWNGDFWISRCGPCYVAIPTYPVGSPSSCGIRASNDNRTFTAIADPNAVFYEFFVDGVSQGRQHGNVLTLVEAMPPSSQVTVQYIFPESFLRPDMVRVQGGSFMFNSGTQAATPGTFTTSGSGTTTATTTTGTSVTLSDFYISRTPITQAQFEAVMGFNPSETQCNRSGNIPLNGTTLQADNFSGTWYGPSSARPVERITYLETIVFANRLSILEDRDIFYTVPGMTRENWLSITWAEIRTQGSSWAISIPATAAERRANNGFRLLSTAEWEFAARGGMLSNSNIFLNGGTVNGRTYVAGTCLGGGTTAAGCRDWFFSNGNDARQVWHINNAYLPAVPGTRTMPVGMLAPNALGLYDMSGNVTEWIQNSVMPDNDGGTVDPMRPPPPSSTTIGLGRRGGAHNRSTAQNRLTNTSFTPGTILTHDGRQSEIGFRLAASVGE